jgi:hypothetical protein
MEVTMVRSKLGLLLGMLLCLAGCGGGSGARPAYVPEGSSGGSGYAKTATADSEATAPQSAPAGYPSQDSPKMSAESRGGSSRAEAAPPPRERPGLGTEWGESRTSRVHDVAFVRESGAPFATAMLHYNDRRGVEALADYHARHESFRDIPTGGGAVSISVRDESGDPLEAIKVSNRTFVVGEAGQRYTIVLTNRTSHRFEAVTTVDGLDVVNGRPGSFENRGYVLMPWATLEIEGFRESSSRVASFRFAAVKDSYAAQTGSARNVGVIGIALFGERGDAFIPESELRLRDTASPFPADPRYAPPPPRR